MNKRKDIDIIKKDLLDKSKDISFWYKKDNKSSGNDNDFIYEEIELDVTNENFDIDYYSATLKDMDLSTTQLQKVVDDTEGVYQIGLLPTILEFRMSKEQRDSAWDFFSLRLSQDNELRCIKRTGGFLSVDIGEWYSSNNWGGIQNTGGGSSGVMAGTFPARILITKNRNTGKYWFSINIENMLVWREVNGKLTPKHSWVNDFVEFYGYKRPEKVSLWTEEKTPDGTMYVEIKKLKLQFIYKKILDK